MLLGTENHQLEGNFQSGFNPQRGFMLLGTNSLFYKKISNAVSIPREDSCFWELDSGRAIAGNAAFQSPERIHAFGNVV